MLQLGLEDDMDRRATLEKLLNRGNEIFRKIRRLEGT